MKNILSGAILCTLLLSTTSFAAKLVISEVPLGLEYSSIAAAILDSDPGDTLVVEEKSTGD